MNRRDDYIAGPHNYWVHFWCGLVFGAILGTWLGWQTFTSGWLVAAAALLTSPVVAFACGRWGDPVWHWIISRLF
jgi:hypothetical protein